MNKFWKNYKQILRMHRINLKNIASSHYIKQIVKKITRLVSKITFHIF